MIGYEFHSFFERLLFFLFSGKPQQFDRITFNVGIEKYMKATSVLLLASDQKFDIATERFLASTENETRSLDRKR